MSRSFKRPRKIALQRCLALAMLLIAEGLGCASPGPPHAPSLNLPKPVSDLTAERVGDHVELRFTAPARTTDNVALRPGTMHGTLCREVEHKTCVAVGGPRAVEPSLPSARNTVSWTDDLPAELAYGPVAALGYRVELFNAAGKSAGKSDVAYTASGKPPEPFERFTATGSRLGVVLRWAPAEHVPGDVLLRREEAAAGARSAAVEMLVSAAEAERGEALDTTAKPETPYRYTAERRLVVQVGGRALPLRSARSAAAAFTLHLVYPPLAPTGLTAAGYVVDAAGNAPAGYAVDLVWQPVDETGLLAGLAGYNVYRNGPAGRTKLNPRPVQVPAFHDGTALATERYEYSVTAVDAKGNESVAVSVAFEPSAKP